MRLLTLILVLGTVVTSGLRAADQPLHVVMNCDGKVVGANYIRLLEEMPNVYKLELRDDQGGVRTMIFKRQWLHETDDTVWFSAKDSENAHALIYWDKKSGFNALDFEFRFPGEISTSMRNALGVNLKRTNTYHCR